LTACLSTNEYGSTSLGSFELPKFPQSIFSKLNSAPGFSLDKIRSNQALTPLVSSAVLCTWKSSQFDFDYSSEHYWIPKVGLCCRKSKAFRQPIGYREPFGP
jgi:hypothetical protein